MLTAIKHCARAAFSPVLRSIGGLIASILCACSGSGVGLDAGGEPLNGTSGGGAVPLSADFDSIQANVFTPICSVCHSGATAPEGLMLDAQHSYSLLVSVASTEVPSVLRVDPGNPSDSYIIQKLEGHAAVGAQMPLGQPPLPSTTIAFIAQWITDGAPPGQSSSSAAFAVAAVAPLDGAELARAPPQLMLSFTRELDATHLDVNSARLERLTPADAATAGTSMPPVRVPLELQIPAGNGRTLVLTARQPLQDGDYQIVLSSDAGDELTALDGARLTHEASSSTPEADQPIARFSVRARP